MVHPRSRGEIPRRKHHHHRRPGSPPLARGNPGCARRVPGSDGVHPRSRGEIEGSATLEDIYSGSPPLARGNLGEGIELGGLFGFTPARAGKSGSAPLAAPTWTVHPRSRGEIGNADIWAESGQGSPPLARGNLFINPLTCLKIGFTPARAGKSAVRPLAQPGKGVHPRSRGEIVDILADDTVRVGSPPLARGNPLSGL